ncbi:hypothetical protein B0H13DRAFT_1850827 [Mycena leptocephala]|nr:hypothetical protein B0H13DRAFT_1850827 [Mycena leptocephala]
MDMQLLVKFERLDTSIWTQILREKKGTIYQIKSSSVHTREDELHKFTRHVHRCPSELPMAVQCKLRKARELNDPLVSSQRKEAVGPRCNWPNIEIEDSETRESIRNAGGKSFLVAFQVTAGIHCVPWARRQRLCRWGSADLDRPYNRQRLLQYVVNPGRQNYADPASAESAAPARQMSTDVSPSRQGGWTGSGNAVIGCQLCSEFLSPADKEILKIVLGHVLSSVKGGGHRSHTRQATKVCLWCLTIPLPGIAPLVVAAMPIHDSMSADDLFGPPLEGRIRPA